MEVRAQSRSIRDSCALMEPYIDACREKYLQEVSRSRDKKFLLAQYSLWLSLLDKTVFFGDTWLRWNHYSQEMEHNSCCLHYLLRNSGCPMPTMFWSILQGLFHCIPYSRGRRKSHKSLKIPRCHQCKCQHATRNCHSCTMTFMQTSLFCDVCFAIGIIVHVQEESINPVIWWCNALNVLNVQLSGDATIAKIFIARVVSWSFINAVIASNTRVSLSPITPKTDFIAIWCEDLMKVGMYICSVSKKRQHCWFKEHGAVIGGVI